MRIDLSGFLAYIVANLVNAYILSRWKVLLKGRLFWMRSMASSVFSEALYSFMAILLMEIKSIPINGVLKIIMISFSIKITYSVLLAGPAQFVVNCLKKWTGIDVYEFPKKFTPTGSVK